MNRLLLLSGSDKREGWTTLDANSGCKPDIVAEIPPLPPAMTAMRWDEIECIHGINVIYPWVAAALLPELYKVMAPDGVLIIEVPNIVKAIERFLKDRSLMRMIFGDPSSTDPAGMVKWGYTPESLEAAVRRAGFTRVKITEALYHMPSRDFRLEARP